MSYRDPSQALEPCTTTILGGIEDFYRVTRARILSDEWKPEHIDELAALREECMKLETRLLRLRRDNW